MSKLSVGVKVQSEWDLHVVLGVLEVRNIYRTGRGSDKKVLFGV